MKTTRYPIFALIVLLSATFFAYAATAPETYSVTISSQASINKLDWGRVQSNSDVCVGLSLAPTCTQAQACVAKGVTGGASCTAADALAAGVRVYADSQAGREGFVLNNLVKAKLDDFSAEQTRRDKALMAAWCLTATTTQKNNLCALIGLSDGCKACNGAN